MSLILVEGVDGCGKSTYVRQLVERLAELGDVADVFHRGPPRRHVLEEYTLEIESYRPRVGPHERHVICDRWHVGERVYGPVLRGKTQLDLPMFIYTEMFLRRRGALLLWLDPPTNVAVLRATRRGEKLINRDQFDAVVAGYRSTVPTSLLETRRLALTSEADVHSAILQAQLLEDDVRHLSPFLSLIGSPSPQLLILGERRGNYDRRHLSAFVPYPPTSGHFLLSHLPAHLLPHVAIANAREENVEALWLALGQPRVLALGGEAQQACREAGLVASALPHPAYVRRFKYDRSDDYTEAISDSVRRHVSVSW